MIEVTVPRATMMEFMDSATFHAYLRDKFVAAGVPVLNDGSFSRLGSFLIDADPLMAFVKWRWYEEDEPIPDVAEYAH